MALDSGQLNLMTKEQYWPTVVSMTGCETAFMTRLFKNKETSGSGISFKWTAAVKLNTGQWYAGYEILDTTPVDEFAEAEVDWASFQIPVSISGDEMDKNQGKEAFHDILANKMKVLTESAQYYIGEAIFKGPGSGGAFVKHITGIAQPATTGGSNMTGGFIAETPASSVVAGITRGTTDAGSGDWTNWFYNQTTDGGDAAFSLTKLRKTMTLCESKGKSPTIWVTTPLGLDTVWANVQGQQRFQAPDAAIAAIGFKSLSMDGTPMVADVHCYTSSTTTSANYYCINEPDLVFRFLKGKFMARTPWMIPTDQDAQTMRVYNKFTLAVKNPRIHGVYHSVLQAT